MSIAQPGGSSRDRLGHLRLPLESNDFNINGRLWTITAVENQDLLVDLADDLDHMPYGYLLWESAVGLARHIARHPELVRNRKVLELGCGVGLPGLIASGCGAAVTQTDHERGVLAIAAQNAVDNGIDGVVQLVADWREWRLIEQFDLIIGADVLYERSMHFYLERIFQHSLHEGGSLLIADPCRPQTVEFMAGLERSGWTVEIDTTSVCLNSAAPDAKETEVVILLAISP